MTTWCHDIYRHAYDIMIYDVMTYEYGVMTFAIMAYDVMTYEYERQEPAPRHGPGPLVPVFPALCAGRVPVRP